MTFNELKCLEKEPLGTVKVKEGHLNYQYLSHFAKCMVIKRQDIFGIEYYPKCISMYSFILLSMNKIYVDIKR